MSAVIIETDEYQITDPSEIGIFYRVIARSDGKIIGEVVSLPAAKELAKGYFSPQQRNG